MVLGIRYEPVSAWRRLPVLYLQSSSSCLPSASSIRERNACLGITSDTQPPRTGLLLRRCEGKYWPGNIQRRSQAIWNCIRARNKSWHGYGPKVNWPIYLTTSQYAKSCRIRGYQSRDAGPTPKKKNLRSYKKLESIKSERNDTNGKLAKITGTPLTSPDSYEKDLEDIGLTNLIGWWAHAGNGY